MVSPKSGGVEWVPCDFCSDQPTVLYCRADSAKLCLFCDQHVHSANLLFRKHVRSQICVNCASEAVSVHCSTNNLVLWQECEWGSCSATHDRTPHLGLSNGSLKLSASMVDHPNGALMMHARIYSSSSHT